MNTNDTKELPKMTLEEYEQKYSHRENARLAKSVLMILEAAVGLVVVATLLFVVLRLFDVNRIAGYISIGLTVVFYQWRNDGHHRPPNVEIPTTGKSSARTA